jgi:hypothetical protein
LAHGLSGTTAGTESSTGAADDYIATLRGRRINIFFMGQRAVTRINRCDEPGRRGSLWAASNAGRTPWGGR